MSHTFQRTLSIRYIIYNINNTHPCFNAPSQYDTTTQWYCSTTRSSESVLYGGNRRSLTAIGTTRSGAYGKQLNLTLTLILPLLTNLSCHYPVSNPHVEY